MHWLSLGSIRNSCDVFYSIMGNINCIEKSSQLLVSVPFWSWCLIIELLTDFLENWFKKKVESLIQFIRRRNRLHVWFLSLTERLSHHSYFYTESCNRACNRACKTYFGFPTFVLSAKIKHCQRHDRPKSCVLSPPYNCFLVMSQVGQNSAS